MNLLILISRIDLSNEDQNWTSYPLEGAGEDTHVYIRKEIIIIIYELLHRFRN